MDTFVKLPFVKINLIVYDARVSACVSEFATD